MLQARVDKWFAALNVLNYLELAHGAHPRGKLRRLNSPPGPVYFETAVPERDRNLAWLLALRQSFDGWRNHAELLSSSDVSRGELSACHDQIVVGKRHRLLVG